MHLVKNTQNINKPIEETQINILNRLNDEFGILYEFESSDFIIFIHNSNVERFIEMYVDVEHPFMKKQIRGITYPYPLFWINDVIQNIKINWTKELVIKIIKAGRKFDESVWFDLVMNSSFKLTMDDYLFLKDYIDFNPFSSLINFEWSKKFLHDNFDKLNWDKLSINEGLPWDENLIEEFSDKWKWESNHVGEYLIYNNSRIFWTISLFEKWKHKIDFYSFIIFANFEPNIIIEYYDLFLQTKVVTNNCHRSGGDKEWDDIELIYVVEYAKNPNFKLTKGLIYFSKSKELKVMTCGSYFNTDATFETKSLYEHWRIRW